MGLLDDIKVRAANDRLSEEILFAEALNEMQRGERREGIWAKALSQADFDEGRAKGIYLKLRVQSLKDDIHVSGVLQKEEERKRRAAAEARDSSPANSSGAGASPSEPPSQGSSLTPGEQAFIHTVFVLLLAAAVLGLGYAVVLKFLKPLASA